MNRTALFGSTLLCGLSMSSCNEGTPQKPNIIFILANDMGYGDVSYLGWYWLRGVVSVINGLRR